MELENHNRVTYTSLEFNDFEVFKDAASKWSLDFKQLDAGMFTGDTVILDSPQMHIGSTNFNRKLDQHGSAPAGHRTFIIPKREMGGPYVWRGHDISENDLLIQPKTNEFSSITNPGWGIYTISIPEDIVMELFERFETRKYNILNSANEVVRLPSQTMNMLRRRIDFILEIAKHDPVGIKKKAYHQIFSEEIPSMIIDNLVTNKHSVPNPSYRIRDIAFRKAIDYINSCTTELPSVRELCLISGSSERTLEYAFKEKYGFGPKEYMKSIKLNHIRKELLKSDSKLVKIKDIAHRYGFLHLGHFGSDYKKLFGELPSETILN